MHEIIINRPSLLKENYQPIISLIIISDDGRKIPSERHEFFAIIHTHTD